MSKKYPQAVLITAGTKRLGFHIAKATLEMGYSVILHYRSSCASAKEWLRRRPEYGSRVFFIRRDLVDSPETLIENACELPCRLTGLVNNASLFSTGNLTDPDHLQRMIDIHVVVPARLATAFNQLTQGGWIINITDAALRRPNLTWQNYRTSKLFLEELTRQQAALFAPTCRVNALAPGAMLPSRGSDRGAFDSLAASIPLRRTGSIDSFIAAYRFLATNEYCTGEILTVDGGWHLTA